MKLVGNIRLRDVDKGFQNVKAMFQRAKHGSTLPGVEIGVSGAYGDDVVQYALAHEYGSRSGNHPPKRSFIRATIDANKAKYKEVMKGILVEMLAKAAHGHEPDATNALDQLGRHATEDMRHRVQQGIPPPLKQRTLDEKARLGFPATALIRTGKLLKSIAYQVVGPKHPTKASVAGALKKVKAAEHEHGGHGAHGHGKHGHAAPAHGKAPHGGGHGHG